MPTTVIRRLPLLLTMDCNLGDGPLGSLKQAAVLLEDGRVAWVGPDSHAPQADQNVDGSGRIAMPAGSAAPLG